MALAVLVAFGTEGCVEPSANDVEEEVAATTSALGTPACPPAPRTVRADRVAVDLCSVELTTNGAPYFVYLNPVFSGATDTILATASIFCTRDGKEIDPEFVNDRAFAAANILPGETLTSNRPRFALLPGTGRIHCTARASGYKSDPNERGASFKVEGGVFAVRGPSGPPTQNIVKSSTSVLDGTSPSISVSRKNIRVDGSTRVTLRGVVYATVCAASDVARGRCSAKQAAASTGSISVSLRVEQYEADGITPCAGSGTTFPAESVTLTDERHHLTHSTTPRVFTLANIAACPRLFAAMTVSHREGSAVIVEAESRMTRLVVEAN